jgi:hypothetical protein
MSMLPPVFVELKANISEFTTAMGEARTQVAGLEKQGVSSFDKLATFGKAALFGLGAAAVGVGTLSLHMADEFEQSHAKLEQALKNAGASFEEFATPIGDAQKKMEQYGYTNAQTQEALGNLTTALKDPKKALDDLSLAADLAKFKHIDLASAATVVARAQEGNLRALKQLGIDLPVSASGAAKLEAANIKLGKATDDASSYLAKHSDALSTSSKYHDAYEKLLGKVEDAQKKVNDQSTAGEKIIKGLSDAIGGQASASAETFAGKMAALKAQSEDVAKNIGMALIPVLEKLMTAIKDVVDWFGKHKAIAEAIGIVIGTILVAAIGAYVTKLSIAAVESVISLGKIIAGWVATGSAATVAGIEMAIASGGITLAIGAIVAGVVFLVTHWKESWETIKSVTMTVWDAIKSVGSGISGFFRNVVNEVKNLMNEAIGAIDRIISSLNSILSFKLPSFLGGATVGINIPTIPTISTTPTVSAATVISNIAAINANISALSAAVSSGTKYTPKTQMATGGIVNKPTVALIGEGTEPEAVIPLSRLGNMGGGMNVVVNVHGSVVQEHDLAVTVRDQIAQMMRRRGLSPSILGV